MRLRLDLAYDGTEFFGWARQPSGLRTVQGTLEDALDTVLRLPAGTVRLTVAGRTDTGVHARGQVAHLDLDPAVWEQYGAVLLRRVSGALPKDVRVRSITEAPPGFDARFAAVWRRYAYRISDHPGGVDPMRRGNVLWHNRPLDVDRMNAAAQLLTGEQDFAAYCKKREGATTIRCLQHFSWQREVPTVTDEGPGYHPVIVGSIRADAFCHNMVRALVGAHLFVGEGKRPVEWPAEVLRRGLRDSAVHVAQPTGLTLEEVAYPADDLLAARVTEARNVRTLPVTVV